MRISMPGIKNVLLAGLVAVTGVALPAASQAADYPTSRPINVLVGFPAGGPSDHAARIMTKLLQQAWPQAKFIVMNQGGANGTIANSNVAHAAPDGYTLLLGTQSMVNIPYLHKKVPYDTAKDLVPVAMLLKMPNVLVVGPSVKAKDYAEFMQQVKAAPGKYTAFSSGIGSDPHLAVEEFMEKTGYKMLHVPYKGGAAGLLDMIAGRVDCSFATLGTVQGQLQKGQVRAFAVGSEKPYPLLPGVPTFEQLGVKDFAPAAWYGVLAPKGTPAAIVDKLNKTITQVMNSKEGVEQLASMGATPTRLTPEEYNKVYQEDIVESGKLIKHLGIEPS
ncbi:tripartite tricarboxylate transporter substrate binding protein [Candidimonas humi]|jgi:tripartite-type tricarboxylate transporter receptor subunit TctC|uniref:Bug family tripartite tricarboxylate transporter substrate binding protein n=1 Tax=Candidimonas humi TaxID=683355 RepID=A0ABV8P2I1_9BURK|nr:tripartite tricarboxylate transporter substrate binding protein [Candidimonas humi]MBV6306794.1 tripartite tricarboxylate transporter substrate binding protein [Candidimonas humi]